MTSNRIAPHLALGLALIAAAYSSASYGQETETLRKEKDVRPAAGKAALASVGTVKEAGTEPVTYLGLEVTPADETLTAQLKLPPDHGLVVRFVVPDSPAAHAGLKRNDVLVRLDDQRLIEPGQLSALVRSRKEGEKVEIAYLRAGTETRATATLVQRELPAAAVRGFHWIGRTGGASTFESIAPMQWRSIQSSEFPGFESGTFTAPAPLPGSPSVMLLRPEAHIVYRVDDMTLEVSVDEKARQLKARDAEGNVLFDGPISTPEERAAVPAELQEHLKQLDALEHPNLGSPGMRAGPEMIGPPSPVAAPGATLRGSGTGTKADVLFKTIPASPASGAATISAERRATI